MTTSSTAYAHAGPARSWLTAGLLHVLAGFPWTGGARRSRAVEQETALPRPVSVRGSVGGFLRALDGLVEPVTLPAGREGARPTRGAAA